ncbi:MAG: leucine--tRNA ligase [Gemmatimonadota bacterium]
MSETPQYDPQSIEAKWQARWAEQHTNEPDLNGAKRPFYNLMMFPYPSAEGLHVGNMFAFSGGDIFGRFKRLQGYDVFEPMGFDAFGIHSENFAIKQGIHPGELIPRNIANFRRQFHRMGGMFDWRHELSTTDPAYYKWTQWIFLQLYKAGKAYKKRAAVNWCPECKTVLANEQVINGFCERHPDTRVEQRMLEQWFFRIAEYAPKLLANLEKLDWSESTRQAQRNWIGRSDGARITFNAFDGAGDRVPLEVFTTRPDTIFGATYLVIAPEHPAVERLTTPDRRAAVTAYLERTAKLDLVSRKTVKEKTGEFTGSLAENPATGARIPVWVADYVLLEYGTGAIMAVPAHDERDFEFAHAFDLPVVQVLAREGENPDAPVTQAFTGVDDVRMVNSGRFNGMTSRDALGAIVAWLEQRGIGQSVVNYRIHDWCISRQRYWGPPIPMIYCDACGPVPVPESDLPVLLPPIEDFRPDDSGISPLARHKEWYHVACPVCGAQARRETDVSDTFLDSAWYYLRYTSTEFQDRAFDPALTRTWLPVTTYIGGNEHAVLHLLYSRFICMVLNELGLVDFEEPFTRFRAHGTIVKDGAKMSKSRGNVVVPDDYIAKWGADTFRMYLMSLGPFQEGGDFRDAGISGPRRFLDKVWAMVGESMAQDACGEITHGVGAKWHQTKRKVQQDMEDLKYNTAISAMMELVNTLREENCAERQIVEDLVVMLAPIVPHFSEECWERLGHQMSVFDARWPHWDPKMLVEETVEVVVQVSGRTRSKVTVGRDAPEAEVLKVASEDATTRRFIEGKETRKVIYVPNRLINIVVGT